MCDLRATAVAAGSRYGVGAQIASTCDVGVRGERRQTLCAETFRMGNATRRRGGLRPPNNAFLSLGASWGPLMFKFTSAVMAAATIAGVLTLPRTSARLDASPLGKPEEASLKACTDRPWPYLNCSGSPLGNPRIRLLTADKHLTPSAGTVRVSDAQSILFETSQIQDW